MCPLVLLEMVRSHQFLAALITCLWPVAGVYSHISFKLIRTEERPCANFPLTFVGPVTCVSALVIQEAGALGVSSPTVLMLEALSGPCTSALLFGEQVWAAQGGRGLSERLAG